MRSKTGRFRRADRLLRTQDFRRVIRTGRRQTSDHFVVVLARRASGKAGSCPRGSERADGADHGVRLGVTVSRQVGNAVVRNRVKRLVREWFRSARSTLPSGSDLIVIARGTACGLSGSEASASLNRAIHTQSAGSTRAARTR